MGDCGIWHYVSDPRFDAYLVSVVELTDDDRADVEYAVSQCPTQAIRIED